MEEFAVSKFTVRYVYNKQNQSKLLRLIVEDPDQVIDTHARILKHDHTTTVALLSKDGESLIIKRYNTKNLWHALRRPFRRSRAANYWHMAKLYEQSGLSLPNPVAYIENRFGPLRGKSYFINEYIQGENLLTYLTNCRQRPDVDKTERQVIELFEMLYSAGIVHGDMKATNILVHDDKLFLLDLDASRKTNKQVLFARGYKKDRGRFLKNWENHPELYARFNAGLPGLEYEQQA